MKSKSLSRSSLQIVESLKYQLHLRGLGYKDLARAWGLSESSVKRLMTSDQLSLEKIDKACELLQISVGDFFKQISFDKKSELYYLTPDQEQALANEPEVLHYFLLIEEGWMPSEIVKQYSISSVKNTKILTHLEKLGLIELLPQNRIKRSYVGQLSFRLEGPIGQRLEQESKSSFLQSDFKSEGQIYTFIHLNFIPGDAAKLKQKMSEMTRDLIRESDYNRKHPNAKSFGLMMALRPWNTPLTQALKRRKNRLDEV